jgi:methylthioribulose-1-phosphate dehydratase
MNLNQSRETLVRTAREFYEKGWMLGTSGNLSIRVSESPLQFLITASGLDKGSLQASDILLMGENSQLMESAQLKPSAETSIHEGVYRKLGPGAVYHVHSVSAALITQLYEDKTNVSFTGLEMIKGLDIWDTSAVVDVPILENLPSIPDLASEIVRGADRSVPGVLIRRHGLYAWGANPFEAKRHVEIFEYLFQYNIGLAKLR